jgi:hypothetical protein
MPSILIHFNQNRGYFLCKKYIFCTKFTIYTVKPTIYTVNLAFKIFYFSFVSTTSVQNNKL